MSGRAWQIGGLAVLGGVGYYMYQAGGDPQAAQKRAEADATKLSNKVKEEMPGSTKEAKKDAEVAASDVSARADQLAKDAKSQVDSAAKKAESNINAAVNKFDKTVEDGASKAKSGISGWFGGSEKK